MIYYPQTVSHDFGQTEWSINPFWLFAGHVQMNWHAETPDTKIYATLRFEKNQTQLLETEATIPAQTVSAFYPAASLISPRRQVSLRSKKLAIGASGIEGDVEILWHNATSSLSAVQPLGDYRLEINGTGKTAALKLSTAQGVLELTGQGQFQMDTKQIQLTGSAIARERQAELEPLLKLFGDDQGNGKRLLMMNGRLPL